MGYVTDDLSFDAFNVGIEYSKLLDKAVDSAFNVAMECLYDNNHIDNEDISEVSSDAADDLTATFINATYVVLHFGVLDIFAGVDYENSPYYKFQCDVYDRVCCRLEDNGIEIVG